MYSSDILNIMRTHVRIIAYTFNRFGGYPPLQLVYGRGGKSWKSVPLVAGRQYTASDSRTNPSAIDIILLLSRVHDYLSPSSPSAVRDPTEPYRPIKKYDEKTQR